MSTFVIYQGPDALHPNDSHKNRAELLARHIGSTTSDIRNMDMNNIPKIIGLKKLVFWGHGTPNKFCTLSSQKFVELLQKIREKNEGLEAVDMITCNISHGGLGNTPYIKNVLDLTRGWANRKNRKVKKLTIRVPPTLTAPNGKLCKWSVLVWCGTSHTWCYVAATSPKNGSDNNLLNARGAIEAMKYQGGAGSFPKAEVKLKRIQAFQRQSAFHHQVNPTDDFNLFRQWEEKMRIVKQESVFISGTVATLDRLLVKVNG
ncbi:MAG: hypothetical protein AAGD13_00855 [Pseudomonadota bacterium]